MSTHGQNLFLRVKIDLLNAQTLIVAEWIVETNFSEVRPTFVVAIRLFWWLMVPGEKPGRLYRVEGTHV